MTNEQKRMIVIAVSAVIAILIAVRAYLFDDIANTGITPVDDKLESTYDFAAIIPNTVQGFAFFFLAKELAKYFLPVSKESPAPNT